MLHIRRFSAILAAGLALAWAGAAPAADRATLRAFLEVTGFDVAITSMQQGAMQGSGVAGGNTEEFGDSWDALAEEVFDPELMLSRALDMMEAVMPDDLVNHGAEFYASDLGQRLVAAENAAHMTPDDEKYAEGERIVGELVEAESPRIAQFQAMSDAIGGAESSVRSVIELQVRYLTAAAAAGAIDLGMSPEELRLVLEDQAPEMMRSVQVYAVVGSAYAYRDISDEDVTAYLAALEAPEMMQVYEILNAIQFEIMAERYEEMAGRLSELYPQQDI